MEQDNFSEFAQNGKFKFTAARAKNKKGLLHPDDELQVPLISAVQKSPATGASRQ
jgi:hypothetical protein